MIGPVICFSSCKLHNYCVMIFSLLTFAPFLVFGDVAGGLADFVAAGPLAPATAFAFGVPFPFVLTGLPFAKNFENISFAWHSLLQT